MPRIASAYGFPPPPAVAALRSELVGGPIPTALRLLPAGTFGASDGREQGPWELTDADGQRLVAEMAARQSDRYIDYEHATLHAKKTGQQAPAAGWFKALEWRPGDGLWAVGIEWTANARQLIEAHEYRYISPLFSYDPSTGRVLQLLGASLTNDPGLDGLTDLAALAAHYLLSPSTRQEPRMNETLKKLLAALGLAEPADEAAALAAVTALQSNVAALAAQVSRPDPAQFVPIATMAALQAEHGQLQSQLAALHAKAQVAEVEKVIAAGKAAGKITPALEGWARDYAAQNLAGLSVYLENTAVVVPPGSTQTGGTGNDGPALDGPAIGKAALAYQIEQAAQGNILSTVQAVHHVTQGAASHG